MNTQGDYPATAVFNHEGAQYNCLSKIGGRYRVKGILASGGFGLILKAEDELLYNKKVLIKTNRYPEHLFKCKKDKSRLNSIEKFRDRLVFEKKMLLQADRRGISGTPVCLDFYHAPNPCLYGPHNDMNGQSFYYDDNDSSNEPVWKKDPYLVISFVDGEPLKNVLSTWRFRNNIYGNAKQVILQIGRILSGFHSIKKENGKQVSFVYQDLKPDNIIYTKEKQLVLIDFGGFAIRADGKTLSRFVKTGTPGYQPPEFVNHAYPPERIDSRADVFSLGAVVYHVMTGSAPQSAPDGKAVFNEAELKAMPDPWRIWIEKAVSPAPDQRFQDMNQAIKACHALPLKD